MDEKVEPHQIDSLSQGKKNRGQGKPLYYFYLFSLSVGVFYFLKFMTFIPAYKFLDFQLHKINARFTAHQMHENHFKKFFNILFRSVNMTV